MADYHPAIVVLFFVIYLVAGSILLRRWRRRIRWQRPPSLHTDPDGWLSSWFPQLIAMELFAWFGTAIMALWLVFLSPIMNTAAAPYMLLGFGFGLGSYAILMVVIDVTLVVRIRAIGRRNRHFDPTRADDGSGSGL